MKYCIDTKVASKLGLDLPSLFALLLAKTGVNIPKTLQELATKGALVEVVDVDNTKNYHITQEGKDIVSDVLLTSEKSIPTDEDLLPLAEKLMALFPAGKKPGTPYYWKGNKREILLKLKSFYKLYGHTYTEEEITEAAQNYVESFHGDYRFMRLLKYFIWKKEDGVEISELATSIENKGETNSDNDWVNELK